MEALELQKALSLEKRMYALLNEAFDISKQLAEAIERGDQVTIRILLSMRREPLESLRRIRRALEEQRDALAPAQARQLAELLNGAAAAGKEEERLAEQVAVNGRLLRQRVELDRIFNRKLGGKTSLYHQSLDTSPAGGGPGSAGMRVKNRRGRGPKEERRWRCWQRAHQESTVDPIPSGCVPRCLGRQPESCRKV